MANPHIKSIDHFVDDHTYQPGDAVVCCGECWLCVRTTTEQPWHDRPDWEHLKARPNWHVARYGSAETGMVIGRWGPPNRKPWQQQQLDYYRRVYLTGFEGG